MPSLDKCMKKEETRNGREVKYIKRLWSYMMNHITQTFSPKLEHKSITEMQPVSKNGITEPRKSEKRVS